MPQRITLREGESGSIGGIPFTVARARDKTLVAYVASYDADGLMESTADTKRAALDLQKRIDAARARGETSG